MINPNSLSPDFTVREVMDSSLDQHFLFIRHATPTTKVFIEGFKNARREVVDEPYYSYGWHTETSAEEAVRLIDKVGTLPGLGVQTGVLRVFKSDVEPAEYAWVASNENGARDIEEIDVADAGLLRLDIEPTGAIVWEEEGLDDELSDFAVITGQDISSPWIGELYRQTVEQRTDQVIQRNIGALTVCLSTFLQAPFGVPILTTGFTE